MPGTAWYYRPVNSSNYSGNKQKSFNDDLMKMKLGTYHKQKSPEQKKEQVRRFQRETVASHFKLLHPNLNFTYLNKFESWDQQYFWHMRYYVDNANRWLWTPRGGTKMGKQLGFERQSTSISNLPRLTISSSSLSARPNT